LSELQYVNLTVKGHEGGATALKDPGLGAKISLVKSNLVRDKNLPPVGSVLIRSFLGEPVQAELVAMCIKPAPEAGFEYIGPPLNVICAVAPLTIERI